MALRWSLSSPPPTKSLTRTLIGPGQPDPLAGRICIAHLPPVFFFFLFYRWLSLSAQPAPARAHALSVLGAVGAHLFNHAHAGWPWLQLWEE
ncbi:hypothetical protein CCM_06253 [Cordyceps militaris CM01]|uniref:Uncharacterized protein n=1 Tax=Cordyceps militaris (strain CM01) TaxID=983644 RepID=G3JJK5_CORMM|nr:uncharacterized protein CCM_06253 [Cordyceps militaris CM01]EGX92093.1 hypothetical protein CCM_06253 [Cordyceps militaris CM01]